MTISILLVALTLAAASVAPANSAGPAIRQESFREDARLRKRLVFEALNYQRLHIAIFLVTNEVRRQHGRASLKHHPKLDVAARAHAKRMIEGGFFSHQDPEADLRSPEKRAALAGIANPKVAENIATTFGIEYRAGQSVYVIDSKRGLFSLAAGGKAIPNHTYLSFAEAVVQEWMDSPGHRANILAADAVQLGCGAALFRENGFPKFMAVQVFQQFVPIVER